MAVAAMLGADREGGTDAENVTSRPVIRRSASRGHAVAKEPDVAAVLERCEDFGQSACRK